MISGFISIKKNGKKIVEKNNNLTDNFFKLISDRFVGYSLNNNFSLQEPYDESFLDAFNSLSNNMSSFICFRNSDDLSIKTISTSYDDSTANVFKVNGYAELDTYGDSYTIDILYFYTVVTNPGINYKWSEVILDPSEIITLEYGDTIDIEWSYTFQSNNSNINSNFLEGLKRNFYLNRSNLSVLNPTKLNTLSVSPFYSYNEEYIYPGNSYDNGGIRIVADIGSRIDVNIKLITNLISKTNNTINLQGVFINNYNENVEIKEYHIDGLGKFKSIFSKTLSPSKIVTDSGYYVFNITINI